MFTNRISAFDMNLDDQSVGSFSGVQPWLPTGVRGPQASAPSPLAVSMADIYQAAVNRAVQDYQLNKLFNPDFYDFEI